MKKALFSLLLSGVFLLANNILAGAEVSKLQITCFPEATIFIDGQAAMLGQTKELEIIVDVGTHLVTAEATGYLDEEANIEIFPNSITELQLALVKADQDRSQMASIPGGEFKMGVDQKRVKWMRKNIGGTGDDYKASVPKHMVNLKPFKIDNYEVSNRRYEKFIKATKRKAPRHWRGNTYRRKQEDYPVVNVSWPDAAAYCKWAGKRLPTEAEWNTAAAGKKGLLFPWGRKFRDIRANTARERYRALTITGRYEKGVSAFGCYDMAGNVWEWTASIFKPYPGSALSDNEVEQNMRVVRGGSFKEKPFMTTTVYRKKLKADGIYKDVGFRCAR